MIKKIIQNPHARCNFCLQWFVIKTDIKNCLYLCESCFDKAINTTCYKVPSPSGEFLYQIYLIKNHVPESDIFSNHSAIKNSLIEELQQIRNYELQQLLSKWKTIEQKIQQISIVSEEQISNYRQLFETIQNEAKNSNRSQAELLNNFGRTPLKAKDLNSFAAMKEQTKDEKLLYSPLKCLKPKKAISPVLKADIEMSDSQFRTTNSCIYFQKQNGPSSSLIVRGREEIKKNQKNSHLKKSDLSQKSYKMTKDLEAIRKDALKFKIYSYLESQSSVPPALFLVMTLQIYDAIKNTSTGNKCLELVLFNLSSVDIRCYLSMLDWKEIEILKLVKVGLTDEQLPILLDFIKDKKVQTLVVTSNKLTDISCKELLWHEIPTLKNIYLGKNKILRFKIKEAMKELEGKYHVYL